MDKIIFEHHNNAANEYELESAWAEKIGQYYKLDNILFYAQKYSLGDLVEVEKRNGELFVVGLIKESGHSKVRVLFNDVRDVQRTRLELSNMGCASEISNVPILISVDIPPSVDYQLIRSYLEEGEKSGKWAYEEACIAHNGK